MLNYTTFSSVWGRGIIFWKFRWKIKKLAFVFLWIPYDFAKIAYFPSHMASTREWSRGTRNSTRRAHKLRVLIGSFFRRPRRPGCLSSRAKVESSHHRSDVSSLRVSCLHIRSPGSCLTDKSLFRALSTFPLPSQSMGSLRHQWNYYLCWWIDR